MRDTAYRLLEPLGSGAMGEVYLAEHRRLQKRVVIKLLHPHLTAELHDRFRLEAQVLARVQHDNVVAVLDCASAADGRPFLVMEALEGETLDAYVERLGGTLPVEEALHLIRQALAGLHAVHEAGIVHRDVKPQNLFRCASGRLKLLDFGVVKLVESVSGIAPLAQPTGSGLVIGTPKYLSPEQALGQPVDRRTDVYAVAVVLYRLVAGRAPFEQRGDVSDMLRAHVLEPPLPPSQVARQPIPPALDGILLRALAKRPAERFADALAFAGALLSLRPGVQRVTEELGLAELDVRAFERQGERPQGIPVAASESTRASARSGVDPTLLDAPRHDELAPVEERETLLDRALADPVARALFWLTAVLAAAATIALALVSGGPS